MSLLASYLLSCIENCRLINKEFIIHHVQKDLKETSGEDN